MRPQLAVSNRHHHLHPIMVSSQTFCLVLPCLLWPLPFFPQGSTNYPVLLVPVCFFTLVFKSTKLQINQIADVPICAYEGCSISFGCILLLASMLYNSFVLNLCVLKSDNVIFSQLIRTKPITIHDVGLSDSRDVVQFWRDYRFERSLVGCSGWWLFERCGQITSSWIC